MKTLKIGLAVLLVLTMSVTPGYSIVADMTMMQTGSQTGSGIPIPIHVLSSIDWQGLTQEINTPTAIGARLAQYLVEPTAGWLAVQTPTEPLELLQDGLEVVSPSEITLAPSGGKFWTRRKIAIASLMAALGLILALIATLSGSGGGSAAAGPGGGFGSGTLPSSPGNEIGNLNGPVTNDVGGENPGNGTGTGGGDNTGSVPPPGNDSDPNSEFGGDEGSGGDGFFSPPSSAPFGGGGDGSGGFGSDPGPLSLPPAGLPHSPEPSTLLLMGVGLLLPFLKKWRL
ncbi:MAG: PEP-CTERM sorting domain-containing protein [Candidatus Omnitrophica bacterium]|nr:PEP-CTERM sorting domain-containing protein [Candidatus Omnitrophota bacterium]